MATFTAELEEFAQHQQGFQSIGVTKEWRQLIAK